LKLRLPNLKSSPAGSVMRTAASLEKRPEWFWALFSQDFHREEGSYPGVFQRFSTGFPEKEVEKGPIRKSQGRGLGFSTGVFHR